MRDRLYWLEQVKSSDYGHVGEQALALKGLMGCDCQIVPSFVISADFFRELITDLSKNFDVITDLVGASFLNLDLDNYQFLQQIAQESQDLIVNYSLSPLWTKMWVEELAKLPTSNLMLTSSVAITAQSVSGFNLGESYPQSYQICANHSQSVAIAVKKVWGQLLKAKSLFFWQKMGIKLQDVNLAVMIQPLVSAIASGTATIENSQLTINGVWGLDYALNRGKVLPDTFRIDLATGNVLKQQLGNKNLAYYPHKPIIIPDYHVISRSREIPDLEVIILSDSKQQQFVLNEEDLQRLVTLIQNIVDQKPNLQSLSWILTNKFADTTDKPQFYITKVSFNQILPELIDISQQPTTMTEPALIIQGISAAPGRAIAPIAIITPKTILSNLDSGLILVFKQFSPEYLDICSQAAGLILEGGSLTSHIAIIARELGIPTIINAHQATKLLENGQKVLLDATTGHVYDPLLLDNSNPKNRELDSKADNNVNTCQNHQQLAINNLFTIATQLMVNISQSSSIDKTLKLPIDGIGLIRSDFLITAPGQKQISYLNHLKTNLGHLIQKFAQAYPKSPIFYRSLDDSRLIGGWGDGGTRGQGEAHQEIHFPLSNLRGTASYQSNSKWFQLELEALFQLQNQGYTQIRLVLPFVRTVEEFIFCRQLVEKSGLTQNPAFELWIMAEVPSVLFLLPEYVSAGVQGIVIGTNDLTQLFFGIDRDDANNSNDQLNASHPALLAALKQLITTAKQLQIGTSICSQTVIEHTEIIESLIRWGIDIISVETDSIMIAYGAIARAERKILLELARQQSSYLT